MSTDLPDFAGARVLVAGDVMLDRFFSGDTGRVSPEAPVPVVRVTQREDRAGGAGNVALNLARLGCRVSLFGLCGDDDDGDRLEELLQSAGVQVALRRVPDLPTIVKLRVLSRHQQLLRLDFEQPFPGEDSRNLADDTAVALDRADALVLSDYDKGALAHCGDLISAARERGIPVLVDPKGSDWSRYHGATALTPNQAELEQIVGALTEAGDIQARGRALIAELELDGLVVTRGERGMLVLPANGEPVALETRARDVYDVTGAGDTVIATLAACLSCALPLVEAAGLANTAAGIVVGKLGTATVSPSELRRALAHQPPDSGVVDEKDLLARVSGARQRGERVVMTNGCFDLLHAGHVSYLREIAAFGDRLVVAVNDDDSVRRLKGPNRPLNGQQDRMAVLAALGCVDWVVPFSEDTPERLIGAVLPDVLAKGGDYRPEEIAGARAVTDAGGEVRVVSFLPGRSTSSMIARIREGGD